MAQDIRKMFRDDKGLPKDFPNNGHQARFESRLDAQFGTAEAQQQGYLWMKIAAVLVVLIAVGGLLFSGNFLTGVDDPTTTEAALVENTNPSTVKLSDHSPEFKKLEDYYLASINVELAQLNVNDQNKDLVDSFMVQLEELNNEYQRLNTDLAELGVNDQTVTALIDNLRLRLDLLTKLKMKLKSLKENQSDEMQTGTL